MHAPLPLTRDLLLIGGGHTHALVARMWGMRPLPGVRLTLVNPGPVAPYTGMLPGHVAEHYSQSDLEIDLVRLARFAGARLIMGRAVAMDPAARQVTLQDGRVLGFDVVSVDIGIHAEMPAIPGFSAHAVAAKPLDVFAARWRAHLAQVASGAAAPTAAVIGGGIAGVELALPMAHAIAATGAPPAVTILERAPRLTGVSDRSAAILMRQMARLGVSFVGGITVASVGADHVRLADGRQIAAALTVGAAGAFAHPFNAASGLALQDGFIRVNRFLQAEGHDGIFAVGDCAHLVATPRPKAGVFAVREAPVLAHNLRVALAGGDLRAFRPQRHYLKLITLGGQVALAERGPWALHGAALWRLKDRIDRGFMAKFHDLPQMPAPRPPAIAATGVRDALAEKPLCGGCGAKVGPDVLQRGLAALPATARRDVLSGPGDDAAVLQVGGATQVLTTDHLRAFTEDPAQLTRIAVLHAMGDVWAMGADPQAALLSVILPRQSAALQGRAIAEILAAAQAVLTEAGAALVGGHTTLGAELTIGVTLTGLCPAAPIGLAGGQPGDALILTRPLGSGVILAAEMAQAAPGRVVADLLAALAQPQGPAAAILRGHAHAMTDVTGFGLAGHLAAMARAEGLAARLTGALPAYPGVADLLAQGHGSQLALANRSHAPVTGADRLGPLAGLFYDPQTAGPLLAAVDPGVAARLLHDLYAAGSTAAIIGHLEPGPAGAITLVDVLA